MTKLQAMFWNGETLSERLKTLIDPVVSGRVGCTAYTLSIGPEVYVSPIDQTADPITVTIRKLSEGEAFTIPPGQFAFLLTEEIVSVPADALAFISNHPIHRSRAWSLNAPACQPMSASQCSPSTATWRTLRPTSPRNGR